MTQALLLTEHGRPVSLYEDWQLRRSRLATFKPPIEKHVLDAQLLLLDRLIERYASDGEALRPARFPLPHAPLLENPQASDNDSLFLNRRVMVLHHHLRRSLHASRDNAGAEIGDRIVPVVHRIARRRPRPVKALYNEAVARNLDCDIPFYRQFRVSASVLWSAAAEYVIWTGEVVDSYVRVKFAPRVGPEFNEETVAYLSRCAERPSGSAIAAVALLQCCDNASVVDYGIAAWRGRLMKRPPDIVLKLLEDALCQASRRKRAADRVRIELASEHAAVRLRALGMLERLGNLDDVNLLMDLACLPHQSDEGPREREALLQTMHELSGFSGPSPAEKIPAAKSRGGPRMQTSAVTSSSTLYDDWLRRRKRLTAYAGPFRRAFVDGERRVLDFLIEHHRNSTHAACPARFAMPGEVFSDRRAIVVFHHLGKSEIVGVKTEQEATQRASTILRRMASMDLQNSAKAFSDAGHVQQDDGASRGVSAAILPTAAQLDLWQRIEEELVIRGPKAHCNLLFKMIEDALKLGPTLPEKGVYYLSCQLANPDSAELLARCDNKSAVDYVIGSWRRRAQFRAKPTKAAATVKPAQPVLVNPPALLGSVPKPKAATPRLGPAHLLKFFCAPARKELSAEKLRRELLSIERCKPRLQAIRMLGRVGSLDDVSLLSDLLSLPRLRDEDPRERPAMLQAMCRLAGMRRR